MNVTCEFLKDLVDLVQEDLQEHEKRLPQGKAEDVKIVEVQNKRSQQSIKIFYIYSRDI